MKRATTILIVFMVAAGLAVYRSSAASDRLHYITTAHQAGPVGYRDPIGAISPDGVWLAYISNRHLYLHRIAGSITTELFPADDTKVGLAWLPDSRHLAVQERPFAADPRWFQYDVETGKREAFSTDQSQLAWSSDARSLAGIVNSGQGSQLWISRPDGSSGRSVPSDARLSAPAWMPDGQGVACLTTSQDLQRVMLPCGDANAKPISGPAKAWGSFDFSSDRRLLYYSIPNTQGTLDLWSRDLASGETVQLTHFDRDTYAPSVAKTGDVLFKTQVFHAFLGISPAEGGNPRIVTTFTSETPTWAPDGSSIGFTFGNWRRVIDDALYPDIAQDLGIIRFDDKATAPKPSQIFQASTSEDQGMSWSPNGKWIVFHSHRGHTDDLFLQRADGSEPVRQITHGGTETGWPRWSPDGKWIAYGSYPGPETSTRCKLYVLGIDQNSGAITQPAAPIAIDSITEDTGEPNWMPDSAHLVFDSHGDTPGRKTLQEVDRIGGKARKILDYDSDQIFSGISVSPDGKWIAYVATAKDGTYQVFRVSTAGGSPQQATSDPTNKTQPAFSPDGKRLAFTIWTYDVQFWLMKTQQ